MPNYSDTTGPTSKRFWKTNNKVKMNPQDKIKELTDLLEEYLPPYLIEEVRGRILDIIKMSS